MYDNIVLKKDIGLIEHVEQRINLPLKLFNLSFDPIVRNGIVLRYTTKLENLFLSIREDSLYIQNSLCKFYHGYNHINFTYSQLNIAITNLENILGITLRDSKIIRFEFGVVIVDYNPIETFSKMGAYKNLQPQLMLKNSRSYGIFYKNSLQKIKIYDKTFEAKRRYGLVLNKNLVRVEKVYSRGHLKSLAKFKNNRIVTLGDLCMRENIELLGEDLIESLNKIELKNIPEKYHELSTKNLRNWGYFQYEPTRSAMRKYHPESYKVDRLNYNRLQKDYRQYRLDYFLEDVLNKVQFCINN